MASKLEAIFFAVVLWLKAKLKIKFIICTLRELKTLNRVIQPSLIAIICDIIRKNQSIDCCT
jgi:hypothetical protein